MIALGLGLGTEKGVLFPDVFLSLFGSPIGGVTAGAAEFAIFRLPLLVVRQFTPPTNQLYNTSSLGLGTPGSPRW